MSIKKGYQVQIRSWENDGDHVRTEVISGLSRADAAFYVSLASKFSKNRHDEDGSGVVADERLISAVKSCLDANTFVSNTVKQLWTDIPADEIYELVTDMLLSWPDDDYGSRYLRRVDGIKVYFLLEDSEDVTIEFKMLTESV